MVQFWVRSFSKAEIPYYPQRIRLAVSSYLKLAAVKTNLMPMIKHREREKKKKKNKAWEGGELDVLDSRWACHCFCHEPECF